MSNQLPSPAISPCYGLILAVALTAIAKANVSNSALNLLTRPRNQVFNLGNRPLAYPGPGQQFVGNVASKINYAAYQAIAVNSPQSGGPWIDGEILGAAWGFELPLFASPAQQVTQLFLEKLVTLENKAFSCGGSPNYSY